MLQNSTVPNSQKLLEDCSGFSQLTPVQEAAMPILEKGGSIFALAPTGSGKTLAFLVPLMARIQHTCSQTQLVIIMPTRELGMQIARVAESIVQGLRGLDGRNLTVRTLFSGQKIEVQEKEYATQPHIIVATPGRLADLMERNLIALDQLEALVLDEADHLLSMGFEGQIANICSRLPSLLQVAMFSATDLVGKTVLFNRLLSCGEKIDLRNDPSIAGYTTSEHAVQACTAPCGQEVTHIHQYMLLQTDLDKEEKLLWFLKQHSQDLESALIFCQTREGAHSLAELLKEKGQSVECLSGEMGQVERSTMIRRFRSRSVKLLVATNIAARGIDISELSIVINFDLPANATDYTHRSGRTGRAGKAGWTMSLCSHESQHVLQELGKNVGIKLERFRGAQVNKTETEGAGPNPLISNVNEYMSGEVAKKFIRIHINKGKSSKLRPGDILGALTKNHGLDKNSLGGIYIFDHFSHIEICDKVAYSLLKNQGMPRIKNLSVRFSEGEASLKMTKPYRPRS